MAEQTEDNISLDDSEIPPLSKSGDDNDDELINDIVGGYNTTFIHNSDDEDIKDEEFSKMFSHKRRTGKRPNKDYDKIKQTLEDFKIPKLSRDVNTYRRYFLDIIINGNFRVKYIPSCATRESAENYCKKRLDEDGVPSYRLLPTNERDPNGQSITDINGDKVDDVVIVDRMGFPIIVNGYKLVRASPYKKVYKKVYLSTHPTKELRKREPFNEWVEKQMGKMTIEKIDELEDKIDWRSGKRLDIEPTETMQKYIDHYTDIGLGKPRVKKSITPNGLFATAFSRVWRYFWNHTNFQELKKVTSFVNFLKVCNTVFLIMFEIPYAKDKYGTTPRDYLKYLNAKKGPKKGEINEYLGKEVVKIIKNGVQNVFKDDGTLKDNVQLGTFTDETKYLIVFIYHVAFRWGFNQRKCDYNVLYDAVNEVIGPDDLLNQLLQNDEINDIVEGKVKSDQRKVLKDKINNNINQKIDEKYLGNVGIYKRLIKEGKEKRTK